MIGTAAAAGERGGFVHHDAIAPRGELDGGGQAGETGADNMDGASHHSMIPKSGHRFPACAKLRHRFVVSFDASAGEGRSGKIMLKQ